MRGQDQPVGTVIKLPNGYYNQKTNTGWKLRHRIVMEEHLGRPLAGSERVYFTNPKADKLNPTPDDLEIRVIKNKTLRAKERRVQDLRKELVQLLEEIDANAHDDSP